LKKDLAKDCIKKTRGTVMHYINTYTNEIKFCSQLTFKRLPFNGFTLVEVLITLGIISVIAALTIPNLIRNRQDLETVSQLKKTFSTLSGAYTEIVQEEKTTPENWDLTTTTNVINKFKPYLNIIKDCSASGTIGCFKLNGITKYLNKTDWINLDQSGNSLLLADGTSINVYAVDSANCTAVRGTSLALNNVCGRIVVDLNGFKSPNVYGIDTFTFYLTKYGIVPRGAASETSAPFTGTGCLGADGTLGFGGSCASWVIYNENLDYARCPDTVKTGWSGPTSCE
jgi:prepilin-type N-terminal cleavage/methylation domain-containing protein